MTRPAIAILAGVLAGWCAMLSVVCAGVWPLCGLAEPYAVASGMFGGFAGALAGFMFADRHRQEGRG